MGRFDNRRRHIEVLRLRSVSRGREGSPRVSSVIGGGGGGGGGGAVAAFCARRCGCQPGPRALSDPPL